MTEDGSSVSSVKEVRAHFLCDAFPSPSICVSAESTMMKPSTTLSRSFVDQNMSLSCVPTTDVEGGLGEGDVVSAEDHPSEED